ncbi:integral membrane sensor hybrid histidine kinase [Caballeronia calidae]|uniref:histidine kinase n=1 Tax=Caballeronia calidae TaxID=1777139 RepID=A0A158CY89_9BURK|nr:response regulator [Caballeronia calidae]SAK87325.1 integral membrane sensor hybrid histidine kinase [Caballeronia calidae]
MQHTNLTTMAITHYVQAPDWLTGSGELVEMIRDRDWSQTPLGPIEQWPQSLRTAVSLCLASNFPINIIWGAEHTQIYNDSYRLCCGDAHPVALGQNYRLTWASAWPAIGESFERSLNGETMYLENQRMFLRRLGGSLEETFFTFSHSPIRAEHGGIGGLFHPVTETTATMLAERRTRALRDLAAIAATRDEAEVARRTLKVLAQFEFDLPFVLYYLFDASTASYRLAGAHGIAQGTPATPLVFEPHATGPWPFADALTGLRVVEVEGVSDILKGEPCGPYEEAPHRALVIPVVVPSAAQVPALIVAAASPRLRFDDAYRSFFRLLGVTVSSAVATVRAREDEHRRAEALAEIDRAKTLFFANVSHEFRTPLTLMLGPLETVLSAPEPLAPLQRDDIETAHRNALRLLKLVNTLLDFSRIESGRAQPSFEPVNVASFSAELASNFRSAIERAGMRLVIDCPPLAEPVWIDRDMWEKIVLNLLSNAFKFTFDGEIAVRVARDAGDSLVLTVSDTGTGIRAADLPHLFERFHRIRGAPARSHEGSGIGLALVMELVKLHGGTIDVKSEVDRGTKFEVRIPVVTRERIAHPPLTAPPRETTSIGAGPFVEEALRWLPDSTPPVDSVARDADDPGQHRPGRIIELEPGAGRRATILVADDNADMRDYVRRLLADEYDVESVPDGTSALRFARAHPPDLALVDVMMPGMDGLELLRAMRADPRTRHIPMILLSARAGEESKIEGLDAGADDYLVKPFAARELRARVQAHAHLAGERRRATDELNARFGDLQRTNSNISEARRATLNVLEDAVEARNRAEQLYGELREQTHWINGQREALEAAVNGEPLATSLGILIRVVTASLGQGARAAFYLADEAGKVLHHIVGMGAEYAAAVDGFAIGPESLACGLATHTGEAIITVDVQEDPRWAPWRWLAERFGYRGCWSFPLNTAAGKFIGTMALYHAQPRDVTSRNWQLAALLTSTASIVIARHTEAETRKLAEMALRRSEQQLRAYLAGSFDVVYRMSADWRVMWHLEGKALIADTAEPNDKWLDQYIHPDDRRVVLETIDRAIRTRSVFQLEHRVIRTDGTLGRVLSRATPVLDEHGDIAEWIGTATEVDPIGHAK